MPSCGPAAVKTAGPAPKTVLNVHQVLRTELGDAERKGLVSRNVAGSMHPPCHGIAPEQRCWDDAQLRALLNVAAEHRLGPALWLTAMTGMRRGEVLGLRWSDIDLEAERLSVQRSVTCTGYQHATLLLKAGVPLKVVSERLGHSSPAFTMAVYQHNPMVPDVVPVDVR